MEAKVKVFDTQGKDTRDTARIHVNMIFGTQHVIIVDTKLNRRMKLNVHDSETISEENFRKVFADVVEALHQTGQMADDESAACITFPEGTREVEIPKTVQ